MDTSTILTLLTIATALLFCPTRTDAAIAIQLERLEQIGGAHLADSSAIRVRKFNRTTFTLNGTFVQDLDETYEVSTGCPIFSDLGNWKYRLVGKSQGSVQSTRQQPVERVSNEDCPEVGLSSYDRGVPAVPARLRQQHEPAVGCGRDSQFLPVSEGNVLGSRLGSGCKLGASGCSGGLLAHDVGIMA